MWFTSRPFSGPDRGGWVPTFFAFVWRGKNFRAKWGSSAAAGEDNDIDSVVVTMTRPCRCNYDLTSLQSAGQSPSPFFPPSFFSLSSPFFFFTSHLHFGAADDEWAHGVTTKSTKIWRWRARRWRAGRTEGGWDWPSWRDWPSAMMVSAKSIRNMKCQYVSRWYSRAIITVTWIFSIDDLWQIPISRQFTGREYFISHIMQQ